jgi:DNA-binding MarR family transcriptional regulator
VTAPHQRVVTGASPSSVGSAPADGGTGDEAASIDRDLDAVRSGMARLQRMFGSRRIHSNMAAAAGVGLSAQGLQVLRALADGGPRSVGEVARDARMDTGAVSRQLRLLVEEGLVSRRQSPAHGSVVLVEATEEGRRLSARYERVRTGQLARALGGWSAEERRTLGELLVRLVDDLQSTPYVDPDEER